MAGSEGEGGTVDLRELSAFVHVYECGSLAAASQEEYVSRQALSKAIRHLESQLGPLFERLPRGVAPTELGRAAYPHARRMLEERAALEDLARRHASGHVGSLSLALEANAALTLPAGLIDAYRDARPDVRLATVALPGDLAFASLASGAQEAILAGPPPGGGFAFEPILSGSLTIVLSAASVLPADAPHHAGTPSELEPELGAIGAPGASTSPAGAPDAPIVRGLDVLNGRTIFGVAPTNSVERSLIPFLERRGIEASVVYDRADTALATNEMEAGLGGVIVESSGAGQRFGSSRYVHVPLEGEDAPAWEVGVVYRAGDPCAPVARDFAAFARAFVERDPARTLQISKMLPRKGDSVSRDE